MPYLKAKVNRALVKIQSKADSIPKAEASSDFHCKTEEINSLQELKKPIQLSENKQSVSLKKPASFSRKEVQSNKNIVKNYARAMVNFAVSTLALPYLDKIIQAETKINLNDFRMFMQEQKEDITSIKNLRELLLVSKTDDENVAIYKKVFQQTCVVFVKFFSVNWVYNSKVSDKVTHVRYRGKLLRRIRNPEYFTYLENVGRGCS